MSGVRYAVGFDGGGTKTTGCLISSDGDYYASLTGGATNYSISLEKAIQQELAEMTRSLCKRAGLSHLDALGVCLSGLGQEAVRQRVRRLIEEKELALAYHVDHDARAALYGAFAGGPGIILIAGTGSIAFAQDENGEVYRCGGWGYLLGDEGSGFDIARRGIAAALQALDGRGKPTPLQAAFEQKFAVSRIDEAVPLIYSEYSDRGKMAQLATIVFEHSKAGDVVAGEIIGNAAGAYAELVAALFTRVAVDGVADVALIGNIFNSASQLLPIMQSYWKEHRLHISIVKPLFPAEVGAALLAFASAGIDFSQEAIVRLQHTIQEKAGRG